MYRIGIDLGGTNIAVGLVSEKLEIVRKLSIPTEAQRAPELIVADMAKVCRDLIAAENVDISEIESVGIASPGTVNTETGVIEYANNLPFRKFPLVELLRRDFPVDKISVANDANAAAWGEAVAGAAKGSHNSVMITLGTGVGGGIVINDKIYSGFNGAGGELGHIVISVDGRPCSCGRHGCWEAYSSATALIKRTKEKIEEAEKTGRRSVMAELAEKRGKITARTSWDAMRSGDPDAKEIVDEYVHYLAEGIANIVNIFQPEIISIGGGISNEKDNLLKPVAEEVRSLQYGGGVVKETEIRIAELGNDAGIIGAAEL